MLKRGMRKRGADTNKTVAKKRIRMDYWIIIVLLAFIIGSYFGYLIGIKGDSVFYSPWRYLLFR